MMPSTTTTSDSNVLSYSEDTRQVMKNYWLKHSSKATIEEILFDSNATSISNSEVPEILAMLPCLKDKNILELGSGIGRFTTVLAKEAQKVTTVDFIEKFVEKNREVNNGLKNIEFVNTDATSLKLERDTYDLLFSNWFLMYLNDKEVSDLVDKALRAIKIDGHIFFRESCFHASTNVNTVSNSSNPTKYRSPSTYVNFLQSKVFEEDGEQYGFELVFARPSRTYIEMKNSENQVFFLFKKVKLVGFQGFKSLKEFLDHKQYSLDGILKYERIFGDGFISTGGRHSTEEFLKTLDLKPGQKVLDVGCGIGGGDFMMAEKYGVEVFGLDLATNMVGIAWDRLQNHRNLKVHFEIGDVTKQEFPQEYFDVIYSRDTILHISDKKSLFSRFKYWLKPGGKVFITDYCCGPKPWSPEYTAYVDQRGYSLLTPEEYGNLFKELEFDNVVAEDKTDLFVYYLKYELENVDKIKDAFIKEFSKEDYDYIIKGWYEKLERCAQGHQRWGLIRAQKKKD